jgi:hypothetical protein
MGANIAFSWSNCWIRLASPRVSLCRVQSPAHGRACRCLHSRRRRRSPCDTTKASNLVAALPKAPLPPWIALLRMNLFTHRELWAWLDQPITGPPTVLIASQAVFDLG